MNATLKVVISLDVEEEGLFGGRYPRRFATVENVSWISRLEELSASLDFPLTLFCSYAVFANDRAMKSVIGLKERAGAEIGAHLHHWSTPPLEEGDGAPARTHKLPEDELEAKLETLLECGKAVQGKPLTSFRMGRWDLKARLLPMLARHGILVDSSICPLRKFSDGPDHFMAPYEPWWYRLPDGGEILEAPITQLAVLPWLARAWYKLAGSRSGMCDRFHFFGSVSANPFWHSPQVMRWATRMLARRGGSVLNLFWHSSEMMPGGSPHTATEKDAERFLQRIASFCKWLRGNYKVQGVTASELTRWGVAFPMYELEPARDW